MPGRRVVQRAATREPSASSMAVLSGSPSAIRAKEGPRTCEFIISAPCLSCPVSSPCPVLPVRPALPPFLFCPSLLPPLLFPSPSTQVSPAPCSPWHPVHFTLHDLPFPLFLPICCSVPKSFLNLFHPMEAAHQAPLSHESAVACCRGIGSGNSSAGKHSVWHKSSCRSPLAPL